jgi:hypothetical protein
VTQAVIRRALFDNPRPSVPVMDHLMAALNVSFTLPQPKDDSVIAH